MGEENPQQDPSQIIPLEGQQPPQQSEHQPEHTEVNNLVGGEESTEKVAVDSHTETPDNSAEQPTEPIHLASIDHDEDNLDSTRIEDESKALRMARSGDPFRTMAANNRKIEAQKGLAADLNSKFEEIDSRSDPSLFQVRNRRQYRRERSTALEQRNQAENDFNTSNNRAYREQHAWSNDLPGYEMALSTDPAQRAKYYDERAAKVEEWAAILHDHPLSEAFHESHPNVSVSPASLYQLELEVQKDLDLATDYEHLAENIYNKKVEQEVRKFENYWDIQSLLEKADEVANQEYDRIQAELDTVLDSSRSFYQELFKTVVVQPLRNKAVAVQSMLDEIKSGQAAQ